VLACLAAYWLLVATEGAYLGAKAVALMYDWIADRYDAMKEFDPRLEEMCLSRPFLSVLPDRPASLVLDVATRTGRVPMLLLETATFNGRIVGLDYARRVLSRAASKAAGYPDRLALIWQNPCSCLSQMLALTLSPVWKHWNSCRNRNRCWRR